METIIYLIIIGILLLLAAGLSGLLLYAVEGLLSRAKRYIVNTKANKENNNLFSKFLKALSNDTIHSIDDVSDFYFANYRSPYSSNIHDYTKVINWLLQGKREMMTYDTPNTQILDSIKNFIEQYKLLQDKIESHAPFSDAPNKERGLLVDIYELSNSDEKDILREKMTALANSIGDRQRDIDDLSIEKGKSLSQARYGMWGTIIFGIASLLLTIYQMFGPTAQDLFPY